MNECDICSDTRSAALWRVNGYDIVRCRNCGLVYANVAPDDIVRAYEMDYYKSVYPDYQSDRNIHEMNSARLLQEIERYFAPGTLVEIGSAFGYFLGVCGKRGWKALGYETSAYASRIAREEHHQHVENTDFLAADIRAKVDVVCMFDTIEHLLRPSLFISKIHDALRKGGGLVVTTGDMSSLMAQVWGRRWRMVVPPLHVYYYSQKTLARLLNQNGFDIVRIGHESKYQNLNSIVRHLFGIGKDAIPRVPVRVNLGDIMLVIARKT